MNSLSIQDLINKKLQDENNSKERKMNSWWASGLGSCRTGRYLERMGVKPDTEFDSRTLRVFSVGRLFEDWIVGLIEDQGVQIETQVRVVNEEYNLTGYADLVVNNELVYEIKSKHSRAFWYMDKKGEGASEHNLMQLWSYLWVLDIPEGRLLYVSKDDLSVLEYVVSRNDPELEKKVIEELEILNEAWEQKLPPEPIRDRKHWHYKYCRFHKQCLSQPAYLKQ